MDLDIFLHLAFIFIIDIMYWSITLRLHVCNCLAKLTFTLGNGEAIGWAGSINVLHMYTRYVRVSCEDTSNDRSSSETITEGTRNSEVARLSVMRPRFSRLLPRPRAIVLSIVDSSSSRWTEDPAIMAPRKMLSMYVSRNSTLETHV